jgi:hypothetical protein
VKFKGDLAYVTSKDPSTVVAARPAVQRVSGPGEDPVDAIGWTDPENPRLFTIHSVETDTPEEFSFVADSGEQYSLSPLTLKVYRKKVLPVRPMMKDYGSEAEMRKALLSAYEEKW